MSKMRIAVAIVSALTLTTRLAAADDAPESKDRDAAFKLSAGATLVSIGLVVAGASTSTGHDALTDAGLVSSLITPSAGELYAGQLLTPGMGLRAASAGIGLLGVNEALHCGLYLWPTGSCRNSGDITQALILVGAIGYVTGTLYDIATAGRAVDDYNQRLQLRVTPTVIPTASSSPAVGLGLGGSF